MNEATPSLRELFETALALAPEQRAAFLAGCTPDRRAALEQLLAADDADEARLLDQSLDDLLGSIGDAEEPIAPPPPGSRVGPFVLIDRLGEGGSSIVYRAEREQAGVRQSVALKLLRHGLYTEEEQRRFRRERLALAQLRHPGIARLIEGGVTDAGIPYIALELIDGSAITEHVRSARLDLRARLRLFVDVCRAVEAAHRALIVHRDLKPSNVLVTREGEVKLLDFGIAKLLDADADDAARTAYAPMTPAYAAPEQFERGPITTATDVYALGVLLGELVTGQRREHGDSRTPSSQIGENTAPGVLPAAPRVTRRLVRGDIDNIVMKATAAEPERRYPSAGALADDVERLLDGRPVAAHPPSRWYRTRKFVARHRGGVATTAALVLAILAALGIALWQADVARRQAGIAREQAGRAEAVRDLLVGLFDANIPSRPHQDMPDLGTVLEEGARHALADLGDRPAVQSELLIALGRVYDHLALPDKGAPLLDAAIAAARRVDPPDPALLGAALSERGEADLTRNDFTPALARFDQAVALQSHPKRETLALALTLDRRALAESDTAHHDAALADYRNALAIRERLLPANDPEILNSYDAIGTAFDRAGRPADATAYLKKAVDGAKKVFGENHVKTAHYLKNWAANEAMLRHYPAAAELTERVVRIEHTLYPPGSPDVVNGLNNLGSFDLTLGRLRDAKEVLEEARDINRKAGFDDSLGQSFVLGNLARVEAVLGDARAASATLDDAIRIATKVVGADHPRTISLLIQKARLAFDEDHANAAALAALAQRILDRPEQLAQFRARSEPEARTGFGLAEAALGRDDLAGPALERAVADLPTDHVDPLVLPSIVAWAGWQASHGKNDAAEKLLRDTLARASAELPKSHYALGELRLSLAEMLAASNPAESAKQAALASEGFAELPESHPWRRRLAALARR